MEGLRIVIDEDMKFAGDFDFPGLGKGGAFSLFVHGLIFMIAIMVTTHQKKNDVVLTEITMVDQIIPVPEEEAPPPPPVAPPKDTNVWDFLKQVIPVKQDLASAPKLPVELPKAPKQDLAAMPQALDLGSKKNLNQPMIDKPLDLVGRKAIQAPAGMDVNPLQMNRKTDTLATSSQLPTGLKIGAKSSWLPSRDQPIMNAGQFARRADLQARGGSLADMPTLKKPAESKKAVEFDTSSLKIERSGNTFKIFGALQNRPILEKYLPKYPRWAEEQGLECNVTIHFFVLPDGSVKNNLFVEQGSGYSEMDEVAMKALRAFKFAPISSGEEQEGVIVFYFRLSR